MGGSRRADECDAASCPPLRLVTLVELVSQAVSLSAPIMLLPAYLLLAAVTPLHVAAPGLARSSSGSGDSSSRSSRGSGRVQKNVWGLPELIHIDWKRIADLPMGVEDNSGGFIDDDTLVRWMAGWLAAGTRGRPAGAAWLAGWLPTGS